jgi:hypothetical protein
MTIERVPFAPLAKLLKQAAPAKALELDQLLSGFSPLCEIDRADERLLFRANCSEKLICIGLRCTLRLHAHAYAAAVILEGLRQCENRALTQAERLAAFHPADHLLNWAVARDLQQWLREPDDDVLPLESILRGGSKDLPEGLLASLPRQHRIFGEGLFRLSAAFILLHEIGHLTLSHVPSTGFWSREQEWEADRFAAAWLIDGTSSDGQAERRRLSALFGISVALLWPTLANVYLGRHGGSTHPEPYDRLFHTLDQFVDRSNDLEYSGVWHFVATMLYLHMDNARYVIPIGGFSRRSTRRGRSFD